MQLQENKKQPILIVDRDNMLGEALSQLLVNAFTPVVVTKKQLEANADVVVIPYTMPLPQLPEAFYKSIILILSEKEEHLLEPFVQKAAQQQIRLFVIALHQDDVKKDIGAGNSLLILGDLFAPEGKLPLTNFLTSAKATKKISLPDMGLRLWYPVLYEDAVKKITDIIQTQPQGAEWFIGPKHPYTALSIAHALQKIDSELVVDFSQEKSQEKEEPMLPGHSVLLNYDASAKLQNCYREIVIRRPKQYREVVIAAFPSKKEKKKFSKFAYWIYLAFLIIFFPVILVGIFSASGFFLLYMGVGDIKAGNMGSSLVKVQAADTNFSLAQETLFVVKKELDIIGQAKRVTPLEKEISLVQSCGRIIENSIIFYQSVNNIIRGKTLVPQTESETAVSAMRQAIQLLQSVSIQDVPKQYQSDLATLQKLSIMGSGVVDSLPDVLGVAGDRTYLVLFQNNMELRPGGGFIGSYGLLTLHNGALKDFSIHDVYDADGQLTGHVEPPFAIRRYIPLVHLYLRDSNFDPDFSKDAKIAAVLLAQETGVRVDGVMGIDLFALQDMLEAMGGVYVPSYGETVTKDNFFQLIEKHAEKNFFPGSTQKKDFLSAFSQALFAKLQSNRALNVSSLLQNTFQLLAGKDVAIAFSSPTTQDAFAVAGLSGTLPSTMATVSGTFNDFSGFVEANLGVNKVNAFVTRTVSQKVNIDDKGTLQEIQTLTLRNDSDGSWPGGVYRNFIRFILPSSAVLEDVMINSVKQQVVPAVTDPKIYEAKSFSAPRGLEVAKENENNLTLYGFLVTVPTKSEMTVSISYVIPHALPMNTQTQNYSLSLWKQSGVAKFPYTTSISIPSRFQFLPQKSQQVTLNGELDSDRTVVLPFAAK